ncbi:MBL fold metallo-hydrolase [Aquimarina addita]|uniref:MBL fold metallo-hydrolase n=1 Tax=Aquimarina addita TaxID=870485 RepID=A0ABP6UL20_9FLAO
MKFHTLLLFAICISIWSCKNSKKAETTIAGTEAKEFSTDTTKGIVSNIKITPIEHATTILEYDGKVLYIDPNGETKAFENQKKADLVLITDIHGDHMNIETLDSLDLSKAKMIVPAAVAEKLPANYTSQLMILNNGDSLNTKGITIEAIPMYNLREEALKFHSKGRGNGYVITLGDERVYVSGDTEDIPEMRALKNIDIALVCMNLPYTMTVESAASAVLEFKPIKVYPYHYRGTEGLSDVSKFKEIVNSGDPSIDVVQLDWYPNQ